MAKLEINGRVVEVDDSFLKLSPADQQKTVEEIAASFDAPRSAAPVEQGDPMGTGLSMEAMRGLSPQASMPYGEQMANVGRGLDKGVRMAANGATFGLADKFAGGMDALTGQAPSYDAGVKAQRGKTQAIRDESPGPALAGEMAGGLGTGLGLIKNGITLAGRVGPSLMSRVLGYGAEGAAYGAAQGAGNTYSDKAADYLKNAKDGATLGAVIGGGLPMLGSVVSGAYRGASAFLGPRIEGMSRGASSLMRGAAQADEGGLRNLGNMSPEAMLPDAGPAMLGLAQGAGTGTGPGRSELVNALRQRDAGTGPRLARALDDTLGPAPVPSQVEAGLAQGREALSPQYQDVMRNARAVDTSGLAQQLDAGIVNTRGDAQRAMRDVRGMLDIPGNAGNLDPHPGALLSTRQAIDGRLATEADPNTIRVLTAARRQVDEELTRAVPGIKDVDAQYAELSRQSEGLTRGGQILDGGKTAIRPAELAGEIQQGAQPQGTMVGPSAAPMRLRQGVRADIDRQVGTNVNDLTALERTMATPQDWNHQKLGQVFGENARDRLAAALSENRQFRDTYQNVVQNSQTAQRMSAAKAMDGSPGGNVSADTTITGLSLKAVNAISKALAGVSNANTKEEIGRALSAAGPQAQRLAAQLLSQAQTTGSNARAIARLLGQNPAYIGASSPVSGQR